MIENKIKTLRTLLENGDVLKAEKLAEEVCRDYLGGTDIPKGLTPLPLIILPGLFSLTEEINQLITDNQ